ncbi:LPXTG cell wall anchor domain-containing protein [Enterococcus cecorum]|uniref:mucin-binding protein n=1 Tax=Enterococcus cecorum TaxID=44008 RepID=UPI0022DB4983|nr:MucBP domain-containing protein [Enterococcus cecorum]CAI3250745.1 LPXTG cell wall anchor domain-containing protein [Enterococcus cecorum]CAI3250963.1 LPXTG cell wall anchor domain-containing protein [Enterococcus cecorum]CAI3250973.1 LPXTG cell wall anchor domain-containing protein [Enterococcus cecorum]CAI3251399.1 LPXTG cell wall anchor domain-containing protein [Enterococcus cecorum]CAI3257480.1 LPXTG cell wall anchor domain-containing protein [Enterococcus cecorum]
MQKQKRYALRKIAGYGLVSCAVGVMLIGGIPTFDSYDNHVFATESTIQSESPYVSQQAKEALQQAINQVNERSAFTSNQVVMEETAQNLDQDRQTGVGYILKALDSLPESIRKFVTGLSFYQKADGYYGLTQSLAGSTRLNTQYYNLQNFDQALGTLYHEISHSIDGKTYTNNGTEYSLSRDEKVVPLLKAIAPNAPVFETWSNLFAKYVMTRVNQDVARSENENKAMKYFDDLLGEALFGSKAYNQEGMLSVQQDGVSVAIVNEWIQIKIDDGKKFRKGERLLLTVNMPQRNIDAIIPRGDIRIQGVTVGNVKLEYPNLGKTPREVALTAFYEKMRAKELNVWTKADLDEYFEIQKLSDNVWGYVVLSFDSEKINNLSNRTILLKSTELHKDQNVLENRMVYEKRLDVSDKGTNGTLINHKLIKEFANTHSDKWRLNLDDYMGVYDQLMPKTLDNEIIGTLNFNNETVKEFHLRPALWFDQIHDDATGKVRDRLVSIMNYDYDTARTDVNISKNSSFANYSELLRTNVLDVKIPSSMTVVSDGRKSEKERIFEPGDMKQEFFLNSDKSGLTVKPELIGTTQHFSMDKINDYTTVADVIWSDDHSWGSFKPSEVIKDITTHYEWDVIYEKDKITIVNTNEVHMPKYALMENLGPQLSIGKELMFDENVIFNDVDNWKYGGYYYTKGYATSAISGYHHTYYHDSLNNEKKEFTSKPEPYYLLLDLKSIEGSGNQLPHNVVVQYVDQTGKEIKLPKTIKENANYADSYKYEPETIEGYQFMGITEDSAPLKGLVGYTDKVIKVKYFDLSQPTTSEETQTKEITRTIQVTTPDGQTQEEIQKVTYRHTKVTNLITGEVTDKGWSSEHPRFDSYQVPVINGYTATHESIPEMQVENPDMENQIIHVTYSANPQENKVFLWDTELNQSVGEMTINGVTGAEKAYDLTTIYEGVKDKYDVDTNSLTGKYIFLAENNVPIKIPITHKLQKEKETKQATRTIIVHKPDGSSDEVAQNVTFTRTKTTDLATHSVSYADWESDHPNYDEYVVPNIDGYKSSQEKIESSVSTGEDETIEVSYTATNHTINIRIVDEKDRTLAIKSLTGQTGETIPYDMTDMFNPFHEEYMTNESLSGTWNVTESNSDIVIHVKKRFDNDSESKTITRTIHITNPDGTKKDIVQIVTYTRSKSTDLSNNQISFGEWETSKDTFDEMTIPSIHGYTAKIDFVESMKVNPDSENTEISVTYTENVIKVTEEKDFIRQIIVKKPDGTKEMITQKVHGTRIKTVHEASGETSYSDWVLDQNKFDSYNPKQMEGYHVENVAEQEVDINQSEPIVILVEYKVDTSDSGTQTDTPDFSDGSTQTDNPDSKNDGTQTDNPDTSDTGTQTKVEIPVIYQYEDGTVYKTFTITEDKGYIVDGSDLEMLPDNMDFADDFVTYEVKGDGIDSIVRIVKKNVVDQGSQTDNPDTTDTGTQTKVDIPVTYQYEDGSVYKSFTITEDKGYIVDGSDLEMLPDNMDFVDDFVTYEVKGDGADSIVRIVKKNVVDQGSQTDAPSTNDGSTQTDEPATSDNGTQTDNPTTSDNSTQTDNPDTTDTGTQTKVEIPVTYQYEDGTVYKSFTITEDKGYILDSSDLEMLPDNMDFVDDFVTYEVKGDGTDSIVRIVKKNVVDQGSQTDAPSTNDGSSQTDEPTTSDNGTQTDKPDTTDTGTQTNSLPLAEKKPAKPKNNKPNLLQKHKMQYTSSSKNSLPQAGAKEQASLGILGLSMMVFSGFLSIFNRKNHKN